MQSKFIKVLELCNVNQALVFSSMTVSHIIVCGCICLVIESLNR